MIAFATISLNDIFFLLLMLLACSKKCILHIKHLVDVLPQCVTVSRHVAI